MRILLCGAGYSARAFAAARPDANIAIAGTTRSADRLELLRQAGITPVLFNGAPNDELMAELVEATHLVISAAPGDDGDPFLRLFRQAGSAFAPHLRWIGYLSTVGVYGDHGGGWVDETSRCDPLSRRSIQRLEAEAAWTDLAEASGVALATLRLSGIYGPGRNAFVNLANGTARRLVKPGQVFNRIHVADIAGSLWHLAVQDLGGVFNVTDNLPAPPQDVVALAASIMGVEAPPVQGFASAELTPMQRSFYGENKRVSNARLRDSGYRFIYPDYHAGLAGLWAGEWQAAPTTS